MISVVFLVLLMRLLIVFDRTGENILGPEVRCAWRQEVVQEQTFPVVAQME